MTWRDLFTEPPCGRTSITKTWGNIGGAILSAGFLRDAWKHDLGFDDFLGYATALAIVTTPALAAKFLGLRYGQPTTETTNGGAK